MYKRSTIQVGIRITKDILTKFNYLTIVLQKGKSELISYLIQDKLESIHPDYTMEEIIQEIDNYENKLKKKIKGS